LLASDHDGGQTTLCAIGCRLFIQGYWQQQSRANRDRVNVDLNQGICLNTFEFGEITTLDATFSSGLAR
jgi:hypothetical protein